MHKSVRSNWFAAAWVTGRRRKSSLWLRIDDGLIKVQSESSKQTVKLSDLQGSRVTLWKTNRRPNPVLPGRSFHRSKYHRQRPQQWDLGEVFDFPKVTEVIFLHHSSNVSTDLSCVWECKYCKKIKYVVPLRLFCQKGFSICDWFCFVFILMYYFI